MLQISAPIGTPAWFRQYEAAAEMRHVDIQRLWMTVPSIPNPHAGIPFTGPISPDLFNPPSPSSPSPSSGSSSSSSSSSPGPCAACATTPSQWSLTLSGITNNACSDCASFNATWVLDHAPGTGGAFGDVNCRWAVSTGICETPDGTLLGAIKLFRDTGTSLWWLTFGFSGIGNNAVYVLSTGSFDCFTSNVMNRQSSETLLKCSGWPATVTVTPIP